MNILQTFNILLFLIVTGYAIYLFAALVKTRYHYIKLGKKAEFNRTTKERIDSILINVLGQKKLLKDKKSGTMHVMYFYGFLLVQFGAIDLTCPWIPSSTGSYLSLFHFLSRNRCLDDFIRNSMGILPALH